MRQERGSSASIGAQPAIAVSPASKAGPTSSGFLGAGARAGTRKSSGIRTRRSGQTAVSAEQKLGTVSESESKHPTPGGSGCAATSATVALGAHRSPSSRDDELLDDVVAALVSTRGVDFQRIMRNVGAAPNGFPSGAASGGSRREALQGANSIWTEPAPRGDCPPALEQHRQRLSPHGGGWRDNPGNTPAMLVRIGPEGQLDMSTTGRDGSAREDEDEKRRSSSGFGSASRSGSGRARQPALLAAYPPLGRDDIIALQRGRWSHEYAAAYGAAAGAAAMTAMRYSESISENEGESCENGSQPGSEPGREEPPWREGAGLTSASRSAVSSALAASLAELLGDPAVIRLMQASVTRRLMSAYGIGIGPSVAGAAAGTEALRGG